MLSIDSLKGIQRGIFLTCLISALLAAPSFAATSNSENLIVLNESTFVRVVDSVDGFETVQLFKVSDNEVKLVDAIRIDVKNVNFKDRYEVRKLKVEEK